MRIDLLVTGGTLDGRHVTLDQDRVLLGRDPAADIRFDPEQDRAVSARHAELRWREGSWRVRDLNSTNGTFHNGQRLAADATLADTDRLTLGEHGPTLLVRLATLHGVGAAAPHAASPAAAGPRRRRTATAIAFAAVVLIAIAGVTLTYSRAARLRSATPAAEPLGGPPVTGERQGAAAVPLGAAPAPGDAPPGAPDMDYAGVVAANERAVALVAVQMPGGGASSGTAFAVVRACSSPIATSSPTTAAGAPCGCW